MILYKYELDKEDNLVCNEHEFEEKDKEYSRENGYPRMVFKHLIDKVIGYSPYPTLWLLEQDDEKAKRIMTEYCLEMIGDAKEDYKEICAKYNKIIDSMM